MSKQRVPVKRRNAKRLAKRRVKYYGEDGRKGDFIRSLPCMLSHLDECAFDVEAAHVKSKGAGGTAADLVPLCAFHHIARLHTMGQWTFERFYVCDLHEAAAIYERKYLESLT